jgi:hypothetical protein
MRRYQKGQAADKHQYEPLRVVHQAVPDQSVDRLQKCLTSCRPLQYEYLAAFHRPDIPHRVQLLGVFLCLPGGAVKSPHHERK